MLFEGNFEEVTLKEKICNWIITQYQAVKEFIENKKINAWRSMDWEHKLISIANCLSYLIIEMFFFLK